MSTTKYPSWNPFITNVKGHFVEGSVVQLQFGQPDAGAMVLTARVLTVRPDAELHWKGRVFMDGLFDGDHRITLEPRKNGTLFTQEEHFSGLLVGRLTRSIFNGTKDNFDAMDAAIKKRSEATTASELGTTRD